jgi:hypothetical protein
MLVKNRQTRGNGLLEPYEKRKMKEIRQRRDLPRTGTIKSAIAMRKVPL